MRKGLTVILSIGVAFCALASPLEAGFSGTDLLLPSVGRGPGASSSQWTTTVWIANPSPSTAHIQVMFLERKKPNLTPVTVTISVPAGDTARYADAISEIFGYDNKFGALRFVSDQKVVVSCRIFNTPAGGAERDTQGQDYAGTPASFGIAKGQSTQLLGVYQTSVDKSASAFRYSFGLAESAGGTASVHVKALDGTGAVVAEKDYGPLGAYEVEYYPIEDLSSGISSQNLRLEVAMTDGTGKVIAVGSGVANQSNDGTTFEMAFADSLLGGGTGGLSAVAHDATLVGDGSAGTPLGLADGGVTAPKVAAGQLVKSVNGLHDDVTIAAGANVTLTPAGNVLTIAATGGGGGGGSGVPSVNGITSAVTINGMGSSTVVTAGGTITVNTPASLPPSGVAGGDLTGTYPDPTLKLPYIGNTSQLGAAFYVSNSSGSGYGVQGNSGSASGVGGTSISGRGVSGISESGRGVYGESTSGRGVYGVSATGTGVYGYCSGGSNDGVAGFSSNGNGVSGGSSSGRGVWGLSNSGTGVWGLSTSGAGVLGKSTSGYAGDFDGNVRVQSGAPDALVVSNTGAGRGVTVSTSSDTGLWVNTTGAAFAALDVRRALDSQLAAFFKGAVSITGTISKGGGSFKIDHPLDPENKYLYHSFVESPDMKNIYDGTVALDESGEATVELPAWFDALNRDFRYQLTAIGAPGPNLYVAEKIADNRFRIAGGAPGMEVSWQVTGIRKDLFANKYRIPIEEDKPAIEQGSYLHPDVYGQPEVRSVEWARNPEAMRRMKDERAALEQQKPTK